MQWGAEGLSRLQSQFAREMLSWVAAPPAARESLLVRGVLDPVDRPATGRVTLWDGRNPAASVAYDVPLLDAAGGNIPPGDLAAALREALVRFPVEQVREQGPREAFGVPVLDVTTFVNEFLGEPRFHISDALLAAGAAFAAPSEAAEPAELRLRGFLLLDDHRCRLYLDTPASEGDPPFGVDLPLRDERGALIVGATGARAALPTLWETGELERMRDYDSGDPYCSAVYDLVGWLTGG